MHRCQYETSLQLSEERFGCRGRVDGNQDLKVTDLPVSFVITSPPPPPPPLALIVLLLLARYSHAAAIILPLIIYYIITTMKIQHLIAEEHTK